MQPIPKRMVIVSAGVIMNIILAAVGFFLLFLYGFNAPAAVVGAVAPGSPAQRTGLQVGDRILTLNGEKQHDFTKIYLNVALLGRDETVPIEIERPDGERLNLSIRPEKPPGDPRGMLALGILPGAELRGIDPKKVPKGEQFNPDVDPPYLNQIRPGDVVLAVGDTPINDPKAEFYILDRALHTGDGKPVDVTVRGASGDVRHEQLQPRFMPPFGDPVVSFAGMVPRAMVSGLLEDSLALKKIYPQDVICSLTVVGPNDTRENPSSSSMMDLLDRAGKSGNAVEMTVLRGEQRVRVEPIVPALKLKDSKGKRGIGLQLINDEAHAVIGEVRPESAAARAGLLQGATITAIDGEPVISWFDVQRVLRNAPTNRPVKLSLRTAAGVATSADLPLTADDVERISSYRYYVAANFAERIDQRHTTNPLVAARWGAEETRDLILQFYLTIKRMFQGSVPASNLMGPLGIAKAGASFANRGYDWLIWFLSMISANLAVVNFLPIPIVDGGLFLFLIIEKLQGRPVSPRTQSIAQVVGLALILSVFVFVTYHDIMR
jgi:regulator of sigma E protease